MTHASLFSGTGGFDLPARKCGLDNIFQVEIDQFCQKVLTKNFPEVKKYLDIKEFNGLEYENQIDVLTGGFPCQPFSIAGKQLGTKDDRWLWSEMFRVITEVKPRWVIAENVPGLASIDGGLVLEQCLTDLESIGYETQTFIIPALAVNAPHRRNRLWIVANSEGRRDGRRGIHPNGSSSNGRDFADADSQRQLQSQGLECNEWGWSGNCDQPDIADAESFLLERFDDRQREKQFRGDCRQSNWLEVATSLCRVDDGIPNRVDRIKALGNAIVPQIAEIIFTAIIKVGESYA